MQKDVYAGDASEMQMAAWKHPSIFYNKSYLRHLRTSAIFQKVLYLSAQLIPAGDRGLTIFVFPMTKQKSQRYLAATYSLP